MAKKLAMLVMAGAAAFVAGVAPLSAATVRVAVPFAFEAGRASLAAGNYDVSYSTYGGPVRVWNKDKNRTVMVSAQPTGNPSLPKRAALMFERHADGTYRLVEIRTTSAQPLAVPGPKKPALVSADTNVTLIEVAMGQ
jgi:hypothetical protein